MKINFNLKSFLFPFLIMIGIFGGLFLSSFQTKSILSSNYKLKTFQADTSIAIATIRARLGKSLFYIQKPVDCIENVLNEMWNESNYMIESRKKSTHALYGFCSFTIDQTYVSRMTPQKGERVFIDSVFNQAVTVKEYSRSVDIKNYAKGNEMIREFELAVNGSFIFVQCQGYSKYELEKYFSVAKSLSN